MLQIQRNAECFYRLLTSSSSEDSTMAMQCLIPKSTTCFCILLLSASHCSPGFCTLICRIPLCPRLAPHPELCNGIRLVLPATHTHEAPSRAAPAWEGTGPLSFRLWVFFFIFSLLNCEACNWGREWGEGGGEENLVNSWGPSLFIAGLGEMWLTEWCTEAVPVNDFTILHHYPHH